MTTEQTTETTPEEKLLEAANAILAYPGMTEFINNDDPTAAYGIMTGALAELRNAVAALEASS
ncbi:hypothetical protein HB780_05400 (plasmid) [Rhizobium lusitanum]|uniref:hypothetical protein n=1 Tax=Rhizobium lusitanum TaxID=293958 RepID=UPI00161E23A0|nr:hypothetical protein [Rhizobium lusitanum]QND45193.1 hypothetical protein HB780_05400 [Rhizobium lusitanum]